MNILMIKRGAMGDVLMTTPLIRQIKSNVKLSSIDFLVGQSFKSVIKNNPYINKVYSIKDELFNLSNCFELFKILLKFRKHYDYVFVLDKHYYFSMMAFIIGGKRVGFGRDKISRLLLTHYVNYDNLDRYQVLYYLDLLNVTKEASSNYNDIKLDLIISDEDKKYIDDYINQQKINNYVIVVNSGGNNKFESSGIRMLPDDKILYLLEKLSDNYTVLLIGGNLDKEKYSDYCKKINRLQIINLAGKLTLEQSSYIMVHSQRVYTTDCGAMHLGISQGLDDKMVCFFGPTNPKHILPNNFRGKVLWTDQEIYDQNYQFYGQIKNEQQFFTNLDLQQLFINN